MITTKNAIYPTRRGDLLPINIEIINIIDDFKNECYKFHIVDFLEKDDVKETINAREISITYAVRDALKTQIIQKVNAVGTESEINKQILPFALLAFVTNDVVGLEDGLLIYGTKPTDWKIK